MKIRPLDPGSEPEIDLVASRMRETLVEVLGEARGASMYSVEHFIVRVEVDESGRRFGLGSTIFVESASRGSGIAQSLLEQGERWMRDQGVAEAEYCTADHHVRILRLFSRNGYRIIEKSTDMVRLAKSFA
jgi:GNAT superfamily N-acetyltransferase